MKKLLILILLMTMAVAAMAQKTYTQADVAALTKLAESGDAFAQDTLGLCYKNGNGVRKDMDAAKQWFAKACNQGLIDGAFNIANIYHNEKNYESALKWYLLLADMGHAPSMFNVGTYYDFGTGVAKNIHTALEWYLKAAGFGESNALNNLGFEYMQGSVFGKDPVKAFNYFRLSAEQEDKGGMWNVALCYGNGDGTKRDYPRYMAYIGRAIKAGYAISSSDKRYLSNLMNTLFKAADKNDPGACYVTALVLEEENKTEKAAKYRQKALVKYKDPSSLFYEGARMEEKKDYSAAVSYYLQAAQAGYSDAQVNIGVCYLEGIGYEKDLGKAVYWFKKAAEQNNSLAYYNLARCYGEGWGVRKDMSQYAAMLQKCVDNCEYWPAEYLLARCYYDGAGVPRDYEKAVFYLRKAANKGSEQAYGELGECYYYGRGIKQNYVTAAEYLKKNAATGNATGAAVNLLARIYANGRGGVVQNIPLAEELMSRAAKLGDNNSIEVIRKSMGAVSATAK